MPIRSGVRKRQPSRSDHLPVAGGFNPRWTRRALRRGATSAISGPLFASQPERALLRSPSPVAKVRLVNCSRRTGERQWMPRSERPGAQRAPRPFFPRYSTFPQIAYFYKKSIDKPPRDLNCGLAMSTEYTPLPNGAANRSVPHRATDIAVLILISGGSYS